jgi:two-component system sensor histidine kinase UhpB
LRGGSRVVSGHGNVTVGMAAAAAGRGGVAARFLGSLFWRVFGLNAALAVVAVVVLAASPFTLSFPATARQVAVLGAGLVVVLAANAVLLRVSLRPLRLLSEVMAQIDLLRPGARLQTAGASELVSVTGAFNAMLARLESERRLSSVRALSDQEGERKRLAAELHDEIGQSLTGLLLLLQPLVDEAPGELAAGLAAIRETLRGTLDEVRRLARGLRPTMLDDLGLRAALVALGEIVEAMGGLRVVVAVGEGLPLPGEEEAELVLYRIAQEALTNVVRHARASAALVELEREGGSLELRVSDNGRGMLYAAELEAGGMRGMRERAFAVGGSVSVRSRPGGGTVVATSVPVAVR